VPAATVSKNRLCLTSYFDEQILSNAAETSLTSVRFFLPCLLQTPHCQICYCNYWPLLAFISLFFAPIATVRLCRKKTAKIFVAGHRGLVGSAIVRKLQESGFTNLLLKTHSELYLTNQSDVESFFATEKPAYVILGGIHANNTSFSSSAPLAKANDAEEVVVWGSGTPLREFLHVDDLADACVFLMERYSGFEHVNVGSGVEMTIKELAEFVKEVVGFEGKLVWDCKEAVKEIIQEHRTLIIKISSSVLISLMRLNECGFCMFHTQMNREKLMKMANTVRTGGKGTVRRKKKAVHKTNTTDDKKLQSTLKRIGVNSIPAIEEVNIFKDDVVIQFTNPKVQASVGANTWVVSGSPQTKKLEDILPQILSHLGPDNMENLKKLAEQFKKQSPGGGNVPATIQEDDDEDDDVPELVAGETFEAAAEEKVAAASS
ncbi:hypothetical protein IGI04_032322, partial [Brassica rapa subsp. trilocularis]